MNAFESKHVTSQDRTAIIFEEMEWGRAGPRMRFEKQEVTKSKGDSIEEEAAKKMQFSYGSGSSK